MTADERTALTGPWLRALDRDLAGVRDLGFFDEISGSCLARGLLDGVLDLAGVEGLDGLFAVGTKCRTVSSALPSVLPI